MNRYVNEFSKGLIRENPVLRLVLGTCPTLAVTTAAMNGLGMGAAATFVLVCSNVVISLLRKVILLIPLIYLLPLLLTGNQVFAVYLAEPAADLLAATATGLVFLRRFPRILEARRKQLGA